MGRARKPAPRQRCKTNTPFVFECTYAGQSEIELGSTFPFNLIRWVVKWVEPGNQHRANGVNKLHRSFLSVPMGRVNSSLGVCFILI